jgi:hypothetical protein
MFIVHPSPFGYIVAGCEPEKKSEIADMVRPAILSRQSDDVGE